jgi:hypothetical protein
MSKRETALRIRISIRQLRNQIAGLNSPLEIRQRTTSFESFGRYARNGSFANASSNAGSKPVR